MDRQPHDVQLFSKLEERLAETEEKDLLKVKRDRWVILVMLSGMAMTLPSVLGARGEWVAWITVAGLVLELCGVGVFAYRQVRDIAPEFVGAKRKFAKELDAHFAEHEQHLDWLRLLPLEERDRRLAYIEARLESLSERYSIVFGAVDRLGFLPLLGGIFVQVHAIKTVSMMTAIIAFAILLLYGMAVWMARFRLQMQRYARLMRAALD